MRPSAVDAIFDRIPPADRAVAHLLYDGLVARGARPFPHPKGTNVYFNPVPLSIWFDAGWEGKDATVWLHNDIKGRRRGWPHTGLNEITGYEEAEARLAVFADVRKINAGLADAPGLKPDADLSGRSPEPYLKYLRHVVDLDSLLTIYEPIIAAALASPSTLA